MNQNFNPGQPNSADRKFEEPFDLTGLLLDYLSNWKWFLLSVAVMIGLAYYYIATIVPTYEVSASIYLSDENSSTRSNAVMMGQNDPLISMKDYIDETELEILKSRNNLIKIVDSLNLAYSYYRKGSLRDQPLYENNAVNARLDSVSLVNLKSPIFVEVSKNGKDSYDVTASTTYRGNPEEKVLENVKLPAQIELSQGTLTLTPSRVTSQMEGTEKIVIQNPKDVAGALSGALRIEFAQKSTTIIRITFTTTVIEKGDDVINTLIDFYNRQIIEDKNRSAIQTEAFILDRLVMISGELRDVEQRLQDYRQANNITNLEAQTQMNLVQKNNTEVQLAEVQADQQIINTIENIVSRQDNFSPIPQVGSDASLNSVIEAYNKRISQLNRTLESSTPDNPIVKNMQEDLTREKNRILQNIASVKTGLQAKRQSIASIESRSTGRLASLPPIDKGLQEIFREQQVKVNIYTFLLQKREEIALQKTLATPTAQLIDSPIGTGPVSPRKLMILAMAFVIGLLIPGVVIYLRRLIFPIFKDEDELGRITKVPVIGEICRAPANEEIVVGENVSTSAAELFRLLRNNIRLIPDSANKKVILVTSAISGEGKTFVSVNLAMTFALTHKKVVVVGMDIRRPVLAHRFGLSNENGVTTFLSGQQGNVLSLVHQSSENSNLYVLPAGPVPPNPNELLLSDNMTRMIDQLRNEFDYVIIDSAPIGIISDTHLIIPHTDVQLFVTRASYSTRKCIGVLHQAIAAGKLKSPYIVLNGVDMNSGAYVYRRYGHYGHYGNKSYGYGYGYGYSSDDKADRHGVAKKKK